MAFEPKIIEGGKKSGSGEGFAPADSSGNLAIAFTKRLEQLGFRVFISEAEERADPNAKMKDGRLARWDGDHWKVLDGVGSKTPAATFEDLAAASGSITEIASRFSLEADPRKHSAERAATLAAAARLDLPSVPSAPRFTIVPTKGAWLRPVLPDEEGVPPEWRGRIRVMAPDPVLAVLHCLPVDLGLPAGAEFYEPAPLPDSSLLARFLASSLPAAPTRRAVQEFCGYTLLQHGPNLQVFQIWFGGGGNGKGEMLKLVAALHEKVFVYKPNTKSDFALAGIDAASFIMCDEFPRRPEGIEELKSIVGDGLFKINRKGRSLYDARVKGKMIVNSNHLPVFPESNDAIDRRIQIIPWDQKPKEIIDDLAGKILRNEFKQLLDWVLEGFFRLMHRRDGCRPDGFAFEGLPVSQELKRQSRVESDSVLRFLDESDVFLSETGAYAVKADVFDFYREWSETNGLKLPCSAPEFWKRVGNAMPALKSWRQRQGKALFHVSNLVLPKHSPEEARLRDGKAPEPCPFDALPAAPDEAEKAARERWALANPEADGSGSYSHEWDALLPHAKALFREAVAEGVGREGLAARVAAKIRLLGGHPAAGEEKARHRFVEMLLD